MRIMPMLETSRLRICPVQMHDVDAIHHLYYQLEWTSEDMPEEQQRAVHQQLVHWLSLNHQEMARLGQPPYGDRAIILQKTDELIGMCGVVPIVATTEYDNVASQGVMRAVGMRVEENAFHSPPWMQVLGILEYTGRHN